MLALSVRGLSKTYTIAQADGRSPGSSVLRRRPKERLAALADVSFAVDRGEAVGIIGRNGAGKSTLLKILSRVVEPSGGRAEVFGRVGALLEIGTGFHPELTGRENVFLNGAVLGMSRGEIVRLFDEIVAFAGVSRFLDTPVKRYSSGMLVRLAFAVAAHLRPEILIVDEVLAVGDAEFQAKCLARMDAAVRQEGRTVLFVSHNLAAVSAFCPRALVLEAGRLDFDGPTAAAVERYLSGGTASVRTGPGSYAVAGNAGRNGGPTRFVRRLEVRDGQGRPTDAIRSGQAVSVAVEVEGLVLLEQTVIIRIITDEGVPLVHETTTTRPLQVVDARAAPRRFILDLLSFPVRAGSYWIEAMVQEGGYGYRKVVVDHVERAARLEVLATADNGDGGDGIGDGIGGGIVRVEASWSIESSVTAPAGKAEG